jgi:hypothetical protein
MDTDRADTARESATAPTYRKRGYPQFDCVGSYLWIWERLVQTEGGVEVVARKIDRDRPPSR